MKTLVFGASVKTDKYSNRVLRMLVSKNFDVVAFGLQQGVVTGVTIESSLKNYLNIHTVTLYLSSKNQKQYYEYILSLKPKRVLFNPGTDNTEFYKLLEAQNIKVEIACTLVLLSTNQYETEKSE
ncbi:CoA-binding protein [Flavobacteriaceae bacterium]|jgi:predicted CoA-binding protein|nr:CoA-binding protein [Flavobacteriaceae bacterium]